MKIKKILKYNNKLVKLKLIQSKVYNKKQYLKNIKIEDIEYRLKKVLYIIYKYHIFNKKILFVGSPLTYNQQFKHLIKSTKHILLPTNVWVQGALSNKQSCFKHLSKNKKLSEILTQLKKNIDLIVILDQTDNLTVLNEGYITKTPVISINCNFDIQDDKSSYKVPGNFQFTNKKILNNFFYSLLIATLKKGNKHHKYVKKSNPSKLYKSINKP